MRTVAPVRPTRMGAKRSSWSGARLAALDQLEQRDEGRRLRTALEPGDLVVEHERAAAAHEQPEALDERAHGDRAAAHRRRVDAHRRLEQVQHGLGQARGLLVDERRGGPGRRIRRRRRAEDAQARGGAPFAASHSAARLKR